MLLEENLACPCGIDIDSTGRIYIADCHNHRIACFEPSGQLVCILCASGYIHANNCWHLCSSVSAHLRVFFCGSFRNEKVTVTNGSAQVHEWSTSGLGNGRKLRGPYRIRMRDDGILIVKDWDAFYAF